MSNKGSPYKHKYLVDLNMIQGENIYLFRKSMEYYLHQIGETNELDSGLYELMTNEPFLNE